MAPPVSCQANQAGAALLTGWLNRYMDLTENETPGLFASQSLIFSHLTKAAKMK
jgi:hypothetical protein